MKKYKVICYTSFTFSYLAKAQVLAWSLRRFHPDWHLIALITDILPVGCDETSIMMYFDEVLWGKDLPVENFDSWIFKHDIVEACTAVKGPAMKFILETYNPDKVIYLDPDIAVVNPLNKILSLLDDYKIILTPHQLQPDTNSRAIQDNEIGSLKYGIYNLGFIAINNSEESLKFANWWADRLLNYCFDDIPNGLFTDQRWCDHVPVFFDGVYILKDPGFNVASWNLSNRKLAYSSDGTLMVNGHPLCFYHFTKMGPVGETMTSRYANDNIEVYELWEWYKYHVQKMEQSINIPEGWWVYGHYLNDTKIEKQDRLLYNRRRDLQLAFPNPFSDDGYYKWLLVNSNKGEVE